MAEKLLTGASFKAPDWKGPSPAATNAASAALATPPAAQTDAEMEDADASAAAPVAANEAVSTAAQWAAAGTAMGAAVADGDMIGPPAGPHSSATASMSAAFGAAQAQRQALRSPDAVWPPPPPMAPMPARPTAIIRQPGWQPASPQPAPQQQQQQQQQQPVPPQQPQAPVLHQQPSVVTPKTHVNDLPDDVLQHIFSMLPFRKRRRLGKVCCHWRALCSGPSQMWQQVELRCREDLEELQPLDPEPVAVAMGVQAGRHLRWLAPRLTAVRELSLVDWPTDTEAALLPALAAALAGCATLRSLQLGCHLLPSGCAALQSLPASLQVLQLGCLFGANPDVQPELSAALSRLTNLQELQLGMQKQAVAAEIGFPVGVFACSGLRRLRIEAIAGRLCSVLPDGISGLRHLRSLQLPECGIIKLPAAISQLTALTELELRRAAARSQHGVALPPAMAAMAGLRVLAVTCDAHSPVLASLGGLTRLEVNGLASVAEAQRIATDFWQLHAPAGAPLGAPLPPRSPSPGRRVAAALLAAGEDADSDDGAGWAGAVPVACADAQAAACVTQSLQGASSTDSIAAAGSAAARLPVTPPAGGGGRWRIEWRKRGGGRGGANYFPPPGARLRAMLLSVADDVSAWQ